MNSAELYQARREAERTAGQEVNHIAHYTGKGMVDSYACSCGWETQPYFDGAEYAHNEWVKHIQGYGAEINYPQPNLVV